MRLPDDIAARLRRDSVPSQIKAGPMRHDVYVGTTLVRTFRTAEDASWLVWRIERYVARMRTELIA